jgi:hypothetical protein
MAKVTLCTNKRQPARNQQGYIALLTVIIISAILAALVSGISAQTAAYWSTSSNRESKEQGRQLASACAAQALLRFALDHTYSGNETVSVSGPDCTILSLDSGYQTLTSVTESQISDLDTTLQTEFDLINMSVLYLSEIN